MKRAVPFSIVLALVVSLAAPPGAAFALEEPVEPAVSDGQIAEVEADLSARTIGEHEGVAEAVDLIQITPDQAAPLSLDDSTGEPTVSPPPQDDALPPVVPPLPPAIVIAQIQVGVAGDSSDEYVSIYNNGSEAVDVTGWCLRNKSKVFACLNGAGVDYAIDPGAYIGFSRVPGRPGEHGLTVPLFGGNNHIVAGNDTIQLVHGESVVDVISWTAQPSSASYAIERNWDISTPGRLQAGSDAWSWKKSLAVYGRILGLVECGEGVVVAENEQCPEREVVNACSAFVISEVAANADEQFIELRNSTGGPALAAGCRVQTNRTTKSFVFPEGAVVDPGAFTVVRVVGTDLTLTKTTSGTVYLLSSDGRVEVDSVEYSSLAKGTSWALVEGQWVQTYIVTPGAANVYAQYPPCESGYWRNVETGRCNRVVEEVVLTDCGEGRERNPETGRCRNVAAVSALVPCREGQYRSEETNRCRSIATAAAAVLKPCAEGQFRNPETNRCKKIASSDDVALADCGEGRERNPATNRCRNVVVAGTLADTLPFPVEKSEAGAEQFVGWWTLGLVAVLGASYGAWEWREEIAGLGGRVFGKLNR